MKSMENLDELLAKRHNLNMQLSNINNQIEEYYNRFYGIS